MFIDETWAKTNMTRTHGRCTIWTEDGALVATYTQDNLVRSFGDQRDHTSEYRRVM